jgi:hypothetical protein
MSSQVARKELSRQTDRDVALSLGGLVGTERQRKAASSYHGHKNARRLVWLTVAQRQHCVSCCVLCCLRGGLGRW